MKKNSVLETINELKNNNDKQIVEPLTLEVSKKGPTSKTSKFPWRQMVTKRKSIVEVANEIILLSSFLIK